LEGLSRMTGNLHVRFLGGAGAARPAVLSGAGELKKRTPSDLSKKEVNVK